MDEQTNGAGYTYEKKDPHVAEGFNQLQALIAEYELKTEKPTIEGFSMYIERRKQLAIQQYREYREKISTREAKK